MSEISTLRENLINNYKYISDLPVDYNVMESLCGNVSGCPFYKDFRDFISQKHNVLDDVKTEDILTPHILLTEFFGSEYYNNLNYLNTEAAHLARRSSMQKIVNGKKIIISKFKNFIDSHANGLLLCPFCHDLLDYGHVKASIYKYNNQLLIKHTRNIIKSKRMWNEYFEGLING
tara:strand:- start:47 stop:571 length:525 start_codon:yes stop_codon:yes gene_type:complete